MFKTYLAAHDMKGAASLERGGKKGILHIQAVVECTVPCTAEGETAFRAHFKSFCGITAGAKLTFKPFAAGQTISHMLGYLQKDEGQEHYRLVTYNVTVAELQEGKEHYNDINCNYGIGKVRITKRGFVDRIWAFWKANFSPFIVPQDVLLLFMCRSDQYSPCSTWCTSAPGRPLDYQVCCAMMMIAYRPMDTTLAQVRNLFWGWHLLPAAL
ncbi:hypothetical protein COO60DRAFT_1519895, partial [Scenedesmus sp. NREL 46B-D3]